jgi:hypothetical protein
VPDTGLVIVIGSPFALALVGALVIWIKRRRDSR